MFVKIPIEFLDLRVPSKKKQENRIFQITVEGLMIEHYLLYRISHIIDANGDMKNTINFEQMFRRLQIHFPDEENISTDTVTPEDEVTLTEVAEISDEEKAASKDKKEKAAMIKKNRLFAAIKEYLDELMNRKFIVKYELKKYKRPTENNLCGYDGISIVFIGKKKRI